ncbi:hypothetical protein LAUMK13_01700 [Mycobacterium innocens]|uniref:Uncharacterized protein n=1 Tax=Mycobacterium innocens TaxID=2341083 RepID=A0A498PY08_9MYCO|nr:hypothetical protein LAUMK13_01700 [Mycobacterium innocens]
MAARPAVAAQGGAYPCGTSVAAGPAGAEDHPTGTADAPGAAGVVAGPTGAATTAGAEQPAGATGATGPARLGQRGSTGAAGTTGTEQSAGAAGAAGPTVARGADHSEATGTAGPGGAEEAGRPAGAAGTSVEAEAAGAAGPAGAEQPAGSAVSAVTGDDGCRAAAVAAVAAIAEQQPGGPAVAASLADGAGAAGAAAADQQSAVLSVCPGARGAGGPVTDQRAAQQGQRGRIDDAEQVLLNVGGLSSGIRGAARRQGADELVVKRRRVGAERLIGAGVRGKQGRNAGRHLVGARSQHLEGGGRGRRVGRRDRRADAGYARGCGEDRVRSDDQVGHVHLALRRGDLQIRRTQAAPKPHLSRTDKAEAATDGSYRDRVGGTGCLPTMQPARRAAPAR